MSAAPLTDADRVGSDREKASPGPARLGGWLPAFLLLAIIWGASFLFIKVAVEKIHPIYVTLGRCAAGAAILVLLAALRRDRLPTSIRLWLRLAILAFVGNVVPFTLFGYGEQRISSILAGIWNGTTPLTTMVVILAFIRSERLSRRRIVGLLLGFLGMLTVLGVWQGVGQAALIGQLMCFVAAICYGFAIPYTRVLIAAQPELSGLALAAGQLIAATVELLVVAPLLAGAPPAAGQLTPAVLSSVLALGALGTGIAFALNFRVIRVAGASTSSSVTYVVPIVATVVGVAVLGERLAWYEPVGAVIVLAGVALSQGRGRPVRLRRATLPS
jgi:drug/metabolite transporter (DMT)-like permease